MHQNTNSEAAVRVPSGGKIQISKLEPFTILMVESESFMYQFIVQSPGLSMIEIDTGDPLIDTGSFGRVEEEFGQYDSLMIRLDSGRSVITEPLLSANVQASDMSWSYDVF